MIGQMKDRLAIRTLQKVDNGRGGWTLNEVEAGIFWGEIKDLSARNIIQYRQADLNTDTQIKMRATPLINKETVLYARGKKFVVEEVIENDGFLTIMAVGEKVGK